MGLSEHHKQARKHHTGDEHFNKFGVSATIIDRLPKSKVKVRFKNTGYVSTIYLSNLLKGEFGDPTEFKEGFVFDTFPNHLKDYSYTLWKSMISRCYCERQLKSRPNYRDVEVCEEWRLFSNFKSWFDTNYIEGYHLDKDLLDKGSKIYSPTTCVFVPQVINSLTVNSKAIRGELPVGVTACDSLINPYRTEVRYTEDGKRCRKYLGCFSTPESAFYRYKSVKEGIMKNKAVAYHNKGLISDKVLNAILAYEVSIDD